VTALDDVQGNTVEMDARAAGHAVNASKRSSLAPLALFSPAFSPGLFRSVPLAILRSRRDDGTVLPKQPGVP